MPGTLKARKLDQFFKFIELLPIQTYIAMLGILTVFYNKKLELARWASIYIRQSGNKVYTT